ncbi:hypothetical protein V1478_017022 [Vespula squamosa]|uniref:Uncharacterized protein n=1 Tax=Vespula squamosa TaxID=30214 RepID=A0ABD1ZY80_VESSQ
MVYYRDLTFSLDFGFREVHRNLETVERGSTYLRVGEDKSPAISENGFLSYIIEKYLSNMKGNLCERWLSILWENFIWMKGVKVHGVRVTNIKRPSRKVLSFATCALYPRLSVRSYCRTRTYEPPASFLVTIVAKGAAIAVHSHISNNCGDSSVSFGDFCPATSCSCPASSKILLKSCVNKYMEVYYNNYLNNIIMFGECKGQQFLYTHLFTNPRRYDSSGTRDDAINDNETNVLRQVFSSIVFNVTSKRFHLSHGHSFIPDVTVYGIVFTMLPPGLHIQGTFQLPSGIKSTSLILHRYKDRVNTRLRMAGWMMWVESGWFVLAT